MPIQVSRYLCQHCRTEYKDYNTALQCEVLPIPPNPYPEGSLITFENEESLFGSRYAYNTCVGVVLYAHLAKCNDAPNIVSHVWAWMVKPNNSPYGECLVIEGTNEFGIKCLLSSAEDKYNSGFAEMLRMQQQNYY